MTAEPYTPGTAYVLLHHYIGEVDGQMAEWAFVRGGTGGVSEAIAADAREHGGDIRMGARVAHILVEADHNGGHTKQRSDAHHHSHYG